MFNISNKHEEFFDYLISNAKVFHQGALIGQAAFKDLSKLDQHLEEVIQLEHKADVTSMEVIRKISVIFITPIDREDFYRLTSQMESCIDHLQGAIMRLDTYHITQPSPAASEMMDDIVDTLKRKDAPLIVLDEADKLTDQVLYFFISLYNQLEGHCGIILTATSFLKKRIERGVRLNRKGYAEIYSRIGRKFVALPLLNSEDIAAVCVANGVSDAKSINSIIDEAEGDLRRVKRSVWAKQKGGAQ